jgi:RHS repeat-associated protein
MQTPSHFLLTAAPTATSVQFQYQVSAAVGPFIVSDVSLENLGYTITRKTYFLGSQAIATRVSGDLDGNNGLFYIHTDHLGSTSLMSDANGQKVETSAARYLPYGGWRTEPTANLTDRAFTGQKHNMDIGLYYYNARYYAPYINRFISADIIVPNPANPQSFNRYSYVRNNPVNFRDPTGHYECHVNGICIDTITTPSRSKSSPRPLSTPLVGMYNAGFAWDPNPDRPINESYHNGRDVVSNVTTNLRAVATGHVRVAEACTVCRGGGRSKEANYGVGNVVIIEYAYDVIPHDILEKIGLAEGNSIYVQYQHMATINETIAAGKQVQRNQIVGQYGNTGISDGAHLHLEVHMGVAGALGTGSLDGSYETHNMAWHNLSLVNPALLWNIPVKSPSSAPSPVSQPSVPFYVMH